MKDNKKQGLLEISISAVKILLVVLLVFLAFVSVFYGLIDRGDVIKSEPVQFLNDWSEEYDENGNQVISTSLPQNLMDNEYLFFDTRKDVSIYINGELRKDFVEKRDINIPGGAFKRFLLEVPLKGSDSGEEIVIVRKSTQDIDRGIPEVIVGTRSGATSYLFKKIGLLFILSFIVLIFSFVSFVVSIVLRLMYRQRIDMLYGALGIFIIAAWIITDSNLFPFVFGVYHVNGLLSFMLCLMIPLGLVVYLSSIQNGRYKWCMSAVILISVLNAVIWPLLHFTGILPFYNVIDLANGILVFLAVAGIVILIVDAVKGNTVNYRYTFIGFLGFLVGCLIELINVIFEVKLIRESIPMVVGLGFLLTFIVIQQVHDLRRINMEKQHAIDISEAKTRFLASMSHEIRTPINAILGMNEMILRENNDKTIEEYSRNIKTSGNMLLMLVNDVLDFTKIESGKIEIKEDDFNMSDMLFDVMSLIKERAEEKSLGLRTDINGEIPNEIISDEFRIRQVLINLLNNAVKYTDKGIVSLEVSGRYIEDGYELMLRVKDTGKGIRKEDQEHLFEAFSRADLKSNINIEGTGLGLAIVKSIVDSMNGEVGVLSEYGLGSEFWVKLPVKYRSKEPLKSDFMEHRDRQKVVKSKSGFTAPEAKILAVDDNQSNLTIVKLFLKRNGIVPDLCGNGRKAAMLCREKKYDLILLDHMMPEPDGIETLHIIREDAESLNKDTKVVVLTANAVAGSRQMYISEGFDDYLTKPLDSNVFEELVKRMLPDDKIQDKIEDKTQDKIKDKLQGEGSDMLHAEQIGNSYDESELSDEDNFRMEFEPIQEEETKDDSLKSRLSVIEALDYDKALGYCAGEEELLREIVGDVAAEGPARVANMKKFLEEKDLKAYKIEAHSIKSSMATIGLQKISERARRHEYAAKDNNIEFILSDFEEFIGEYEEICRKISECLNK